MTKFLKCRVIGCDKEFTKQAARWYHMRYTHAAPVKCPYKGCSILVKPRSLQPHILNRHSKSLKNRNSRILKDTKIEISENDNSKETDLCSNQYNTIAENIGQLNRHSKSLKNRNSRILKDTKIEISENDNSQETDLCSNEYNTISQNFGKRHVYRCKSKNCKLVFNSHKDLSRHHYHVHTPTIQCSYPDCGTLVKLKYLVNHIKTHHKHQTQFCFQCGRFFKWNFFKSHESSCRIRCFVPECNSIFESNESKEAHIFKIHQNKIQCSYDNCNVILQVSNLENHMKTVHEPDLLETCQKCHERMPLKNYPSHLRVCSLANYKPISCSICKLLLTNENDLDIHIKQAHRSHVKCNYKNCNAIVVSTSLRAHIKGIHLKTRKLCTFCGRTYNFIYFPNHQKTCPMRTEQSGVEIKPNINTNFQVPSLVIKKRSVIAPAKSRSIINCETSNAAEKINNEFFKQAPLSPIEEQEKTKLQYDCTFNGCSAVLSSEKSLMAHIYGKHTDLVSCPFPNCDVILKPGPLQTHIKHKHGRAIQPHPGTLQTKITNSKRIPCLVPSCKEMFFKITSRDSHVYKKHRERYHCPYAGCDAFLTPGSLNTHINYIHKGLGNSRWRKNIITRLQNRQDRQDRQYSSPDHGNNKEYQENILDNQDQNLPPTGELCHNKFESINSNQHQNANEINEYEVDRYLNNRIVMCPIETCSVKLIERITLDDHIDQFHKNCKRFCIKCGASIHWSNLKQHLKNCQNFCKKE